MFYPHSYVKNQIMVDQKSSYPNLNLDYQFTKTLSHNLLNQNPSQKPWQLNRMLKNEVSEHYHDNRKNRFNAN